MVWRGMNGDMRELSVSLKRQLAGTALDSSHSKAFCIPAEGNILTSSEEYTCPLLSSCAGLIRSSLVFLVSREGSRSGQPSPPATEPQVPQPLPCSCLLHCRPLSVTARPTGLQAQWENFCCAPASYPAKKVEAAEASGLPVQHTDISMRCSPNKIVSSY